MINRFRKIKPLIIGTGVAGKRHLAAQVNLKINTGIFNLNPQTSQPFRKQAGVKVFDNLEDAINWSNLVHVCSPDDVHKEYVALALKKGKAVLCEKSFTTSLQDALDLQKLAHRHNSTLIIGHNYRLTPTFLETRKRIMKGQLGTITGIKTTYLHDKENYQKRTAKRKNEDFLYIGGSHAVDLIAWIINEKTIAVQATADNSYPAIYEIALNFSSGLLGHIKLDAASPRDLSGTDLIVEGEKGQLLSHNKVDKLLFFKTGKKGPQTIKLPNCKTYTTAVEVKIINDYLLGRKRSYWPLPDVDEAVNTIRVLDAIEKAVFSGKSEDIIS